MRETTDVSSFQQERTVGMNETRQQIANAEFLKRIVCFIG